MLLFLANGLVDCLLMLPDIGDTRFAPAGIEDCLNGLVLVCCGWSGCGDEKPVCPSCEMGETVELKP